MQSGIHALTSGSNGRSQLKRRGISLNFSAYGLFFYLYDEESRLHRNVGTFYTKMQRSFQGNRILMKCQQSTISQVDSILIIFHSREYKSLVAGRQFSKVTPNICGSSVWNVPHTNLLAPEIFKWHPCLENLRIPPRTDLQTMA